jgi:flagellar hook-associated protein 1 FlgK
MGSLFSILGVAGDGLAAQTAGLDITGQNVANANTPGYSRLSVNLETVQLGDSYGGSVRAANVIRSSDQFAYARVLAEQSKGGAADARSTALAQVEAIVAPSAGTIADGVNAFFASMSTLSSSPSDPSARAAVLGSATSLAQTISSTAAGLASAKGSLLTKAQGVATQVNSELAQIAQLNSQIAQASASGDPAASLSDQRDRLVSNVATEIGAKTVEEPSGITLFAGGTALVVGSTAASINVGLDATGNLKIVANRGGGTALDITSNTNDGTLGGIREARDQDIPAVSSQLDQFASDLATSVNSIHSAGFGLDGVSGRNLFAQPASVAGAAYTFAVDPTLVGHPERIAAAKNVADVPGGNDVAVQLSQLASQTLGSGGTPADRFGSIAASLGAAKSAADAESQLRTDTVTQAKNLHDSSTGAALDEEMANLSKFQRAYEASSKVLQTVDSLLNGLMQDIGPATA